jgi:hypothetical protein
MEQSRAGPEKGMQEKAAGAYTPVARRSERGKYGFSGQQSLWRPHSPVKRYVTRVR